MKLKKSVYNFFIRSIISLVLVMVLGYFLENDNIFLKYNKVLFDNKIDFLYIRSKTNIILGKILPNSHFNNYVTSEKLEYKNISNYYDSYKLETSFNYVVSNIEAGIVYFIGEKDNLGTTVIIKGDNGVNYWYSNIENISVNLYDYINEKQIIGSTKSDYLIMTFTKDNEYLPYEDYI